ncbi:MAG: hypothetical protein Q7R75_01990 [bacterium]|nr:hypothetical protein [bacterium]
MDEPQIEERTTKNSGSLLPTSILVAAIIIASAWIYTTKLKTDQYQKLTANTKNTSGQNENTAQAVEIPVTWGNIGAQMIASGVINRAQFEAIYANRGGLTDDEKKLLENNGGKMIINQENSGFILNLFWALGLSNKNKILEEGPMADPRYGGAGGFASTGGWTIAKGGAMNHYSKHSFVTLTPEQQTLVEQVSSNIYRPCCDNSTYFPDCNHGMAMLGLLELLASQGANENQMYKVALQVNSFWFPEQYAIIARYFASKGQTLGTIDPKEILGKTYSSASGFRRIASLVPETNSQGRGIGCGLETAPQKSSGCGL